MAVQIDLSELLNTPGLRVPCDIDLPCTAELELECAAPTTGSLVFTNTGNLLVVHGRVTASLRTVCPRCLVEVVSVIDVPVDDEFTVSECLVTGRADDDADMADPATAALWKDRYILNVTELIRQSIVLATPIEPLCGEDCLGLCPYCGGNRNETDCGCQPPRDSPFAALAGLYKPDPD